MVITAQIKTVNYPFIFTALKSSIWSKSIDPITRTILENISYYKLDANNRCTINNVSMSSCITQSRNYRPNHGDIIELIPSICRHKGQMASDDISLLSIRQLFDAVAVSGRAIESYTHTVDKC